MKEEKIYLKSETVIGEILDIKPLEKSKIIMPNMPKDERSYYDQHPIQMKVEYVSSDFLLVSGTDGGQRIVRPGDTLYLDRFPSERETVLINKKVLAVALKGNVICCIPGDGKEIKKLSN